MARKNKKGDSNGTAKVGALPTPSEPKRRGRPPKVYGSNISPDAAQEFVRRLENLTADLLAEQMRHMREVAKPIRQDIRSVYDEAKAAGIDPKALRAVVKSRELEAKADKARDDLETDAQNTYDAIRVGLGDFSDTPLGEATLAKAEPGRMQPLRDMIARGDAAARSESTLVDGDPAA